MTNINARQQYIFFIDRRDNQAFFRLIFKGHLSSMKNNRPGKQQQQQQHFRSGNFMRV